MVLETAHVRELLHVEGEVVLVEDGVGPELDLLEGPRLAVQLEEEVQAPAPLFQVVQCRRQHAHVLAGRSGALELLPGPHLDGRLATIRLKAMSSQFMWVSTQSLTCACCLEGAAV